jgi:hypothetical protein
MALLRPAIRNRYHDLPPYPIGETVFSPEYTDKMRDVIEELKRELDHAYRGIYTLPDDHPARVVYERAVMLVSHTKPGA